MARNTNNYSDDQDSKEDFDASDKYDVTGESEFTRESTVPFDQDEVLSERHYNFSAPVGKIRIRSREARSEAPDHRGKGPVGYGRSDEKVKEKVSEMLYRDPIVDASDIEVEVQHGEVTLRGSVKDRKQKKAASLAVEHVFGVTDVFNEIQVNSESGPDTSPGGLIRNRTGMI